MSYLAWLPALGLDCPSKLAGHVVGPGAVGPSEARQACMPCWDSTEQGGNRTSFYFAWLSLGLDCPCYRLARRRTRARQAWDSTQREQAGRSTLSVAAAAGQGNHHRDETEMAFPGRTRLRSPPLEPTGERARPAATLSKGHRAEMELWRNKKALDLRGHRTTPHRSGERRGYRSETESPCDQVNQRQ